MKTCLICKKDFVPKKTKASQQKYCSLSCYYKNPHRIKWKNKFDQSIEQRRYQALYRKTDRAKENIKRYRRTPEGRFASLKMNAKVRKLEVFLTLEDCKNIWKNHCVYCGDSCLNTETGYGIDRLDNKKGYEKNNVVACCSNCNIAKGKKTPEEFLKWMDRLINYQRSNN